MMRTIRFPVLTDANLKAGEVLAQCLNPPASGVCQRGGQASVASGINVTEMAVRLPIAMKLKAANSHIKLEEAEYQELKAGVERTMWVQLNEDIYALCRAVLDAEEQKTEKK